MSPLLFVIAMKGFSSLMDYAEAEKKIVGFGKKGCKVNRLLFADYVMISSKASTGHIRHLEETLQAFGLASRLAPYIAKTKIIFSKSVEDNIKRSSNIKEGFLPLKHLGIPLH